MAKLLLWLPGVFWNTTGHKCTVHKILKIPLRNQVYL